ncbi:MAG: hypothetical protein OHK0022_53840 [Roseiflexaceae bacterium]
MDRVWLPLALLLVALALRCYGLTAPLLDYHSWRQADTAAIARNFTAHGYRLAFPEVDWGGRLPGYVESEFPLYTYSLALLYGLFGVHEWIGRLLTALCSAGAVAALYALARPLLGRRGAAYAGLALALMPFALFFGRTVMPDSLMLLTGILALLSFRAWQEQPTAARLLVALLCGALAPLAKTPNLLILAPPLAYLALTSRPRRWPALFLYGICFALPALLWTAHARTLPLDPRLSFGIGEKLLDSRLLTDPQFYLLIGRWSVENLLTWAGLPLLALGLLPRGRTKNQEPRTAEHGNAKAQGGKDAEHGNAKTQGGKDAEERKSIAPLLLGSDASSTSLKPQASSLLPHFWLLGVLLFLAVGAAGVVGQDYYILPLAGPLAWFVGAGIDRAQRWAEGRVAQWWMPWAVPLLALGLLGGLSLARVAPLYRSADFYQTLGQRVDLALPPGERVGVIAPAVSEILYYAGRSGWRLDPGVIVPGGLASLGPDLGVRYLLITDPWLTERRDVLLAALGEFRRVPVGPYALLLDLAHPGLAGPFELPPETGHLVAEPFLSAWRAAGGVAGLGFPISDALDQPEGRVQFFERGLLVQQGDTAAPAPVGRLLVGALSLPEQPAAPAGPFRDAWEQAGGAAVLGDPLTPPLERDGRLVQFFVYGTLEADPGGTPAPGGAGRRLLDARGLSEERQIELARNP